ncbi:MAG: DUF2971 domain-containing protein [Halodesulfovibrio sp.]
MSTPSKLYKYTPPESAEQILTNTSLKWSSPLEFNDPAELKKAPILSPTIEEVMPQFVDIILKNAFSSKNKNIKKFSPLFADVAESAKHALNNGIKQQHLKHTFHKLEFTKELISNIKYQVANSFSVYKLRILCLAENDNNDMMWSHYASNDTGCCIELNSGSDSRSYFNLAKQVWYHDSNPPIGNALEMLLYGLPKDIGQKSIDTIFYTKNTCWTHEKEWRVIYLNDERKNTLHDINKFDPKDITSITFGIKSDTDLISKLSDIAIKRYEHIRIYKRETTDDGTQIIQLR